MGLLLKNVYIVSSDPYPLTYLGRSLLTMTFDTITKNKDTSTLRRERKMAVHVVIKRKFKVSHPEELIPLLNELNERAKTQEGYISTDTLQSTENNDDYLVISKWETEENWNTWFKSKERRNLQGNVDSLIGERTFYEIFKPVT
jgi:heme-degrading monooxygenase HmoA